MRRLITILIVIFLVQGLVVNSQSSDVPVALVTYKGTLYAMPLQDGTLIDLGQASAYDLTQLPDDNRNNFVVGDSPLMMLPADGFGYYQGVSSVDETQFAYTVIAPDTPDYRVLVQDEVVIASQVSPERGYLVPIGWRSSGELVLLERYTLYSLETVRIWHWDAISDTLILYNTFATPYLSGNHAVLDDGRVILGFDTVGAQTYLMDIENNQLTRLVGAFTLENPPRSVFDTYPMAIVGIVSQTDFMVWRDNPPINTVQATQDTAFLHWMLPDDARSITCYSDSAWTDDNFAVECPGLQQPRTYEGHQGTDVGGLPNGLALGTSVYASRQGLVIKTFDTCPRFDASCGDAYGNHILLQHALVQDGNLNVWFTGYAHLQTVLAVDKSYVEALGVPIALSGDTGLGGAHLHFEVRSLLGWVNPYSDINSLWIGGNEHPLSAEVAFPPEIVQVCQSATDNNIRNGPGTVYDVVGKTSADLSYNVIQTVIVEDTFANGAWYQIQLADSNRTGWLWAELAQNCTVPAQ
ncbi:MAG: peptidoglycan DD-metalloendopeptidase family protein [Chloroflexota bacterium]